MALLIEGLLCYDIQRNQMNEWTKTEHVKYLVEYNE